MTSTMAPRTTPLHEFLARCERLEHQGPAQLLGIGGNADPATVRAAFRDLARRFHPDTALGVAPEERTRLQAAFARLTEAYQALGGDRVPADPPGPKADPSAPPRPVAVAPAVAEAGGAFPVARPSTSDALPSARVPERTPAPLSSPEPRRPSPSERREGVRNAIAEAQGLVAQGDSEGAVRVLHPVVTRAEGQDQREVRLLLARAYLADSRWRRYGITLLREITQEQPPCAEAWALLGGVYRGQGLLARAEATFARALSVDAENAEARSGIRAVRAALLAVRVPAPEPAPRQGLVARLFSMRR
jgi:hypothetical protein